VKNINFSEMTTIFILYTNMFRYTYILDLFQILDLLDIYMIFFNRLIYINILIYIHIFKSFLMECSIKYVCVICILHNYILQFMLDMQLFQTSFIKKGKNKHFNQVMPLFLVIINCILNTY